MDRSGRRYTQYKNFHIYTESVNKNDKLLAAYEKIKNSTRSKNELKLKELVEKLLLIYQLILKIFVRLKKMMK